MQQWQKLLSQSLQVESFDNFRCQNLHNLLYKGLILASGTRAKHQTASKGLKPKCNVWCSIVKKNLWNDIATLHCTVSGLRFYLMGWWKRNVWHFSLSFRRKHRKFFVDSLVFFWRLHQNLKEKKRIKKTVLVENKESPKKKLKIESNIRIDLRAVRT